MPGRAVAGRLTNISRTNATVTNLFAALVCISFAVKCAGYGEAEKEVFEVGKPYMKNCRCDLCGSENRRAFPQIISRPQTVVVCRGCGLIYTNPCWEEAEIKEIYDKVFRDDPGAPSNSQRSDFIKYRTERFEQAQIQVKNHWLPLLTKFVEPRGKKWLDVRFRAGALPVELDALGADVHGIDIFEANADWLQKKLPDSKIYCNDVHNLLEIADADFDVISMVTTHVAAHVPSPTSLFRAAFDKLKAGGILFADEKDVTQITPRATLFPFQYPFGMAHYHHLTLEAGTLFVKKAGFEILFADYTEKSTAQKHFLIVARKPSEAADSVFEMNFDKDYHRQTYRHLIRQYLKIRLRQKGKASLKKLKYTFARR